jgi:DNA-binding NarL/FixJ family response regulator
MWSRRDDEDQRMRVVAGAHRGRLWSLPRGSPDVGGAAPCDDGGVGPTVLIVDDHADFRAFARTLLEAGGFEVVGEARDGASALSAARRLKPALVLLDVQLPDIDGFAVCEQLASDVPAPLVVLTSSREASSYRRRLGASSARGFIPKAELSAPALAALSHAV